jgi:hypothetical protein
MDACRWELPKAAEAAAEEEAATASAATRLARSPWCDDVHASEWPGPAALAAPVAAPPPRPLWEGSSPRNADTASRPVLEELWNSVKAFFMSLPAVADAAARGRPARAALSSRAITIGRRCCDDGEEDGGGGGG